MPKRGIVNVRMVITEEKILSNIEKVSRLINPNSKKQIIELDDNSYFKDLVESIKTYLIEYPKKKNFPKTVYDAAYDLVEYATNQFEENTKQIEDLIRQREMNIKLAAILRQTSAIVRSKDPEWKRSVQEIQNSFSPDVIEALQVVGRAKSDTSQNFKDAVKLINARVANLESNLHIEIDMERVEDRSKALSFIGIEISDALKLIPTPIEEAQVEEVMQQQVVKEQEVVRNAIVNNNVVKQNVAKAQIVNGGQNTVQQVEQEKMQKKAKSSLWNKIKNSKLVTAIKYAFKAKIVLQLPSALPEGNNDNKQ